MTLSETLAKIAAFVSEQESQRIQQAAAQAAAAAAIAIDPKQRKALARMADYWTHEGDALAHQERLTKQAQKKKKKPKKKTPSK